MINTPKEDFNLEENPGCYSPSAFMNNAEVQSYFD